MSNYNKIFSLSLVIIFFSIAGIPPLTGFLSKILIVYELVDSKNIYLGGLLMLVSSISVFYYIRIIKLIYFEPLAKFGFKSEIARSVYQDNFLDFMYLIFSITLFTIIIIFFYPEFFSLIFEYILLTSIGI